MPDLARLLDAKAAGRHRWATQANTAGGHRFFRIVRDRILIAGDMRLPQHLFGVLAGDLFRP